MKLPDWRGRTIVCIASGPSLTPADCELVRSSGHTTIVTNTTFRLCPWAHSLYAFDPLWFKVHMPEVRQAFGGLVFTQSLYPRKGVICARLKPDFRSFQNSGACAISLAIALGSRRVVMLGYDCQFTDGRSHHHGDHPAQLSNCGSIARWPRDFERLAGYASKRGAVVVNASRVTSLTCFPRAELEHALLDRPADVDRPDGGRAGVGTEHVASGG